MPKFTNREKMQEVQREIGQRFHVYPRLIAQGKLTQAAADRQTAIMQEIATDYGSLASSDRPDLFDLPATGMPSGGQSL